MKICLLREVTKKYVADLTSVESQKKLLRVRSGRLPRCTHSSFIFETRVVDAESTMSVQKENVDADKSGQQL